jgi:hypothetical protein
VGRYFAAEVCVVELSEKQLEFADVGQHVR